MRNLSRKVQAKKASAEKQLWKISSFSYFHSAKKSIFFNKAT